MDIDALKQNIERAKINAQTSWFRLYTNNSSESNEAVKLLFGAVSYVTTMPVEGLPLPELRVGSHHYHGLREIQPFVNALKQSGLENNL